MTKTFTVLPIWNEKQKSSELYRAQCPYNPLLDPARQVFIVYVVNLRQASLTHSNHHDSRAYFHLFTWLTCTLPRRTKSRETFTERLPRIEVIMPYKFIFRVVKVDDCLYICLFVLPWPSFPRSLPTRTTVKKGPITKRIQDGKDLTRHS